MRKMGPIVSGATLPALLLVLVLGLGGGMAARSQAAPAERPWLGVMMQALDEGLRDGMSYRGGGVLVSRVVEDSPADKAGVEKGDVITSFNGRAVDSPDALSRLVGDASVGQAIALAVMRDGQRRTLAVRLGTRPEELSDAPDMDDMPGDDSGDQGDMRELESLKDLEELKGLKELKSLKELKGLEELKGLKGIEDLDVRGSLMDGHDFVLQGMGRGRLGLRVEDLSADLAPYFGAPAGSGALVMEVMKDTPAEKVGIRAGDVVTRVGDDKVSDAEGLIAAVRRAPGGKLSVTALRKGVKRTFEPELEAAPRAWREGGRDLTVMGPRRIVIRHGPGGSDLGPGAGPTRDELRELREEVRDLRMRIEKLQNRD